MLDYRRRIIDDTLDELQPHLRALSIHGPKGIGKTATAMQRAASVIDLSLAGQREIVTADPSILTACPDRCSWTSGSDFPRSGTTYVGRLTPARRLVTSSSPAARPLVVP